MPVPHPKLPDTLFKYFTREGALATVNNGRLRWSSPLRFNDPAEFQRMPCLEPSLPKAAEVLPQILVEAALGIGSVREHELANGFALLLNLARALLANGTDPHELQSELKDAMRPPSTDLKDVLKDVFTTESLRSTRVLCVTESPLNISMWANYAESHSGCVLGFRHLPELSTPLLEAQPINYSAEAPIVGSGLDLLLYGTNQELQRRTLDAICFAKRQDWINEREWRVVYWSTQHKELDYEDWLFHPPELESIIFGLQSPAGLVKQVREIAERSYPHAKLQQLVHADGDFALESLKTSTP